MKNPHWNNLINDECIAEFECTFYKVYGFIHRIENLKWRNNSMRYSIVAGVIFMYSFVHKYTAGKYFNRLADNLLVNEDRIKIKIIFITCCLLHHFF